MKRAVLLGVLWAVRASATDVGEEVELSSAPVTARSCAQKAIDTGNLELLTSCPLNETLTGLVVFDVAEMAYYRLDPKSIRTSDLERAFGGGSLDVTGEVKTLEGKEKVPVVSVSEFRVTDKPKAGAFKGCL